MPDSREKFAPAVVVTNEKTKSMPRCNFGNDSDNVPTVLITRRYYLVFWYYLPTYLSEGAKVFANHVRKCDRQSVMNELSLSSHSLLILAITYRAS